MNHYILLLLLLSFFVKLAIPISKNKNVFLFRKFEKQFPNIEIHRAVLQNQKGKKIINIQLTNVTSVLNNRSAIPRNDVIGCFINFK